VFKKDSNLFLEKQFREQVGAGGRGVVVGDASVTSSEIVEGMAGGIKPHLLKKITTNLCKTSKRKTAFYSIYYLRNICIFYCILKCNNLNCKQEHILHQPDHRSHYLYHHRKSPLLAK